MFLGMLGMQYKSFTSHFPVKEDDDCGQQQKCSILLILLSTRVWSGTEHFGYFCFLYWFGFIAE